MKERKCRWLKAFLWNLPLKFTLELHSESYVKADIQSLYSVVGDAGANPL